MINLPYPVAPLLQASEILGLRLLEYDRALLNAARNLEGNVLEAQKATEVCEARRARQDAEDAYSAQACRVLEESTLVVSTIEEIEALLKVLRYAVPPYSVARVEVQGPSVAAARATLEGQGFILRNGSSYDVPSNFLRAADAADHVTPAPAQQQAGGRTSRRLRRR